MYRITFTGVGGQRGHIGSNKLKPGEYIELAELPEGFVAGELFKVEEGDDFDTDILEPVHLDPEPDVISTPDELHAETFPDEDNSEVEDIIKEAEEDIAEESKDEESTDEPVDASDNEEVDNGNDQ